MPDMVSCACQINTESIFMVELAVVTFVSPHRHDAQGYRSTKITRSD